MNQQLIELGLGGLYYVLLFCVGVQALILVYHWFTYGNNRHISLIALALYLGGNALLFLILALALKTL